jgi:chromosome segregation ATPase
MMKLNRLTLTNWRCHDRFELDLAGASASIYARNGAGKSTLAAAYLWLMTGKDLEGRLDTDIKPVRDGDVVHNVESAVEAEFLLDDGDTITLKRIYRETYEQKRGSTSRTFTGHTTDYEINTVGDIDKQMYDARIAGLCPLNLFRLLTDPGAFAALPETKSPSKSIPSRREVLWRFVGDVTDRVVIDSTPELRDLPAILGRQTPDEYLTIVKRKQSALNDELKAIPIRIDQENRAMPAAPGPTIGKPEEIRKAIEKAQQDRANLQAGAGGAEIVTALAQVDADIQRWETEQRRAYEERTADARQAERERAEQVAATRRQIDVLAATVRADTQRLKAIEGQIATMKADRDRLVTRKKELEASVFAGATECPTCQQPLPADRIEAARANWNEQRANAIRQAEDGIRAITVPGQALVDQKGEIAAAIAAAEKEMARLDSVFKDPFVIASIEPFEPDYCGEPYLALCDRKADLNREQEILQSGIGDKVATINSRIADMQRQLDAIQDAERTREQRRAAEVRIAELEAKQKTCAQEYEELDRHKFLLEKFTRTKSAMVTDRINGQFQLAQFRLFEQQINEGIRETCEITLGGVPWGALSTSQRINVGLDIVRTLQRAHGIALPVWVDTAESVNQLVEMDCQVIRLVVNEDEALRVVVEGASVMAESSVQGGLF